MNEEKLNKEELTKLNKAFLKDRLDYNDEIKELETGSYDGKPIEILKILKLFNNKPVEFFLNQYYLYTQTEISFEDVVKTGEFSEEFLEVSKSMDDKLFRQLLDIHYSTYQEHMLTFNFVNSLSKKEIKELHKKLKESR